MVQKQIIEIDYKELLKIINKEFNTKFELYDIYGNYKNDTIKNLGKFEKSEFNKEDLLDLNKIVNKFSLDYDNLETLIAYCVSKDTLPEGEYYLKICW